MLKAVFCVHVRSSRICHVNLVHLSCAPGPFVSDHCVVKVVTYVKKKNVVSKTVAFRNFKEMDKSAFAKDLRETSIDCENINTFV